MGRPRVQAAQRAPPHYYLGCHCCDPCQGLPEAAGDSGVRDYGCHHGVHGMRDGEQDSGSGLGLGFDYGVSWTCQGWGCGTWVPAAPECCHPPLLSWCLSCLCCCWLILR